jgi:tetratricopeptide (TPR) repeat protein
MNKILTGLFLLINITCFSQSVKELEHELSFYKSGEEWGNKKNIAFKLLEIDSLNTSAINYLVEVYGRNNQKDSISLLFDRLIKENPQNPEPYLLRAQEGNAHFAGLSYTQQINYFKEAYELDKVNLEAIYTLGKLYYELFIKEFQTSKKKANTDIYSANSIQYFSIICNQNERYKESLKFPLIQLANYTKDLNKIQLYENYKIQSSYFPISAFVDLPTDWRTNYSINVIEFSSDSEFKVSGVESALFHINWYASHLNALDEPVLSDSLPAKVFRFTWLRTFHNPIVIGLENTNDSITLYWKVCDGAGGYDPGKIIENKSKTLTIKEWKDFVDSINSIDFWNLPTTKSGILGTDGAQWILEGKELGKYHVVDRWSGGTIEKVCLKLLEFTDLKIKQDDIY